MTAAGGESTRPPGAREPVGQPGLRWSGDGALRPQAPPRPRTTEGLRLPGRERIAPSGGAIASFPRRSAGFVIDFLLISTIYAIALALVFPDAEAADFGRVDATWLPFVSTGLVVRVAYNWFWNRRGWSPGKRAWGLHLEGADGARPTLVRALVRALVAEVSLFLWIGYVWASWDRRGQTWHDKAAASWVVRDQPVDQPDGVTPPKR